MILVQCDTLHPEIFLRMSAEHRELRSAALQSLGSVVQQHAADRPVPAQWMAGAELRSLRTDLGSAGLQVSTISGQRAKPLIFYIKASFNPDYYIQCTVHCFPSVFYCLLEFDKHTKTHTYLYFIICFCILETVFF